MDKQFFVLRVLNENKVAFLSASANLFEILIFLIAPFVIQNFGLLWPLIFSQVFLLFRFIGYYYLDSKNESAFYFALFYEMFKGASFGLAQLSAAALVRGFSPENLRASSQIIYNATYVALGTVASAIIFKSVLSVCNLEAYSNFFLINGIITVSCIIMLVAKFGLVDKTLFDYLKFEEKLKQFEGSGAESKMMKNEVEKEKELESKLDQEKGNTVNE